MACPSLPALPVAQQQVMSPSAQEVAAAMAGTGTSFYGAAGDGSVARTSVANGTTAAPGSFVSNNPNSVTTHEVAQRANNRWIRQLVLLARHNRTWLCHEGIRIWPTPNA